MQLNDQVIVVTGGGRGIGAALCRRFAQESPRGVVVADIDYPRAQEVAASIDGLAVACDVSSESQVTELVATTEATYGPIGLFCANAGIVMPGGLEATDAVVEAIERETFLVLPHPEVHKYFQRKAADYDRWLGGMRRLRAQVLGES